LYNGAEITESKGPYDVRKCRMRCVFSFHLRVSTHRLLSRIGYAVFYSWLPDFSGDIKYFTGTFADPHIGILSAAIHRPPESNCSEITKSDISVTIFSNHPTTPGELDPGQWLVPSMVGRMRVKPSPHQQQCRSNMLQVERFFRRTRNRLKMFNLFRHCRKDEILQ